MQIMIHHDHNDYNNCTAQAAQNAGSVPSSYDHIGDLSCWLVVHFPLLPHASLVLLVVVLALVVVLLASPSS